jgi:hypothetical protein
MVAEQPYGTTISINGNPFILAGQAKNPAAVGRARAYQTEVWEVLKTIEERRRSQCGRILMRALNAPQSGPYSKKVTIVPNADCVVDARTVAHSEVRSSAKGDTFRDVDFARNQRVHEGRGVGSSTVVRFEPRTFAANRACRSDVDPLHRYQSDFVLFHELVHALRQMRGLILHQGVTVLGRRGVPIEEFYAIMLTNIYMSECGVPTDDLRAFPDPAGTARYVSFRETTTGFVYQARSYYVGDLERPIEDLRTRMPDLAGAIGNLTGIEWNPLAVRF